MNEKAALRGGLFIFLPAASFVFLEFIFTETCQSAIILSGVFHELEQMIGNAVSVKLVEIILRCANIYDPGRRSLFDGVQPLDIPATVWQEKKKFQENNFKNIHIIRASQMIKRSIEILLLTLLLALCSCRPEQDMPANQNYGKGEDIRVIKFYADWCAPCQAMKPEYEKVKKIYPYVQFYEVDWDKNREKAQEFGINGIPHVIKLTNRSTIKRHSGYMNRNDLVRFIEND